MHVVTISATYGAGGSVVGPAVAQRLGVPFVDRAIPTSVADDLGISVEHALTRDEQVQSWVTRWLSAAAPVSTEWMIGSGPALRRAPARRADPRLHAAGHPQVHQRHRRRDPRPGGGDGAARSPDGAARAARRRPGAAGAAGDDDPRDRRARRRAMRSPATTRPAPPTCGTSTAPTRRFPSTTTWCWTARGCRRRCA